MSTADGKPETINSVSVETAQGYKTFNLMHGDITQVPTDLLVLSAYGDAVSSPEGQVVRALCRRDVFIAPEPHWLNFSERCWTSFQRQEGGGPLSALLTVFIRQLAWTGDPLPMFEEAVLGVFASLAALEYRGEAYKRVSLPVLYGQRILMEHSRGKELYPRLIEILIRQGLLWLKKSDQTHTIQFVVFEENQMVAWDEAMNKTMGRSLISAGSDAVLVSLCQEIVDVIHSRPDGRLAGAVVPLADALAHQDRLSIENVCVWVGNLSKLCSSSCCPSFRSSQAGIWHLISRRSEDPKLSRRGSSPTCTLCASSATRVSTPRVTRLATTHHVWKKAIS